MIEQGEYENKSKDYEQIDEKYMSKNNTPKKQLHYLDPRSSKKKAGTSKKRVTYSYDQYHPKKSQRNIEHQMSQKTKQFRILSRTLRTYFKEQHEKKNKKDRTLSIQFGLKMIKAFNTTYIEEISPSTKELIDQIICSLKVVNKKSQKKSSDNHHKRHQRDISDESGKGHQREFSFNEKINNPQNRMKYKYYLMSQIQMLHNNLKELQQEAEVLQQMKNRSVFTEKNMNKQKYIQELENIVQAQKAILLNLENEMIKNK